MMGPLLKKIYKVQKELEDLDYNSLVTMDEYRILNDIINILIEIEEELYSIKSKEFLDMII